MSAKFFAHVQNGVTLAHTKLILTASRGTLHTLQWGGEWAGTEESTGHLELNVTELNIRLSACPWRE